MTESDKFIGAWRLVSAGFQTVDGSVAQSPYGSEPEGILMYDAQGRLILRTPPMTIGGKSVTGELVWEKI